MIYADTIIIAAVAAFTCKACDTFWPAANPGTALAVHFAIMLAFCILAGAFLPVRA